MKRQETSKNTIIYGGAFNPPTRAHQAILQACVEHARTLDAEVWLLPSGDRSDKTISVSRQRRLQLLQALVNDVILHDVQLDINTAELDRNEQTETYDTVMGMNESYPDRRFIWVFGSDSIVTMPSWRGGEWLVENLPMLVIERAGSPVEKLGRYALLLPVHTTMVSSTEVRRRLAANETVEELVTPSVLSCL